MKLLIAKVKLLIDGWSYRSNRKEQLFKKQLASHQPGAAAPLQSAIGL